MTTTTNPPYRTGEATSIGSVIKTSWPTTYPDAERARYAGEQCADSFALIGLGDRSNFTVTTHPSAKENERSVWSIHDKREPLPF